MAFSTTKNKIYLFVILLICSFFVVNSTTFEPLLARYGVDKIYQLGDSIADTGNLIREPYGASSNFARFPYGENFYNNATGRCSNGLLMIDFIAQAAGLPFLNPYKDSTADFSNGVNFAVAGATALPVQFLNRKGIQFNVTNSSLLVQLDWLSAHLGSLCNTPADCREKLKNTLFMVGEIGGNDFNYAFGNFKTINEARAMVPDVVEAVINAARRVIHLGARRVVIPGNFPIGCMPIYLTNYKQNNFLAYDNLRCLEDFNKFTTYQNSYLQKEIQKLKLAEPNATIIYADYYHAFLWILRNAAHLGFDNKSVQKSCCGIGGYYNFNITRMCGSLGVPLCENPDLSISWDGIHLTEKAYQYMADWIIRMNILPNMKVKRNLRVY